MNTQLPAQKSIEIGAILDSSRFAGLPAIVAVFTTLITVFDGFDIQAIAFASPSLLTDWGIDRDALAPVFAAALLGMGIGALVLGSMGDRYGRRSALIVSMILLTVSTLLCAYASSATELTVYRLLTGIGLGGTFPNAAALIAEYSPVSVRTIAVTVTTVGVPVGGILGAALAAEIIPAYGWRSIFIVGAILTGVLLGAMLLWMPESPRFLSARPDRAPELARLLNRLTRAQRFDGSEQFHLREREQVEQRRGLGALFAGGLRHDTPLVWLCFFTTVFSVYAIFNWLPTVLSSAGLPLTAAIRGSLVFNLGGVVGALGAAALMARFGSRRVLTSAAVIAVLSTFGTGLILSGSGGVTALLAVMTISGAGIITLQVGMYSVGAHIYPTACRASGLGWALGIARAGGVLSSFAGSVLLAIGEGATAFFAGIAAVLGLCLLALLLLRGHMPPTASAGRRGRAGGGEAVAADQLHSKQ
jgi:AAHS family 4-hydroxybenzoate transporter-like MFS transporter